MNYKEVPEDLDKRFGIPVNVPPELDRGHAIIAPVQEFPVAVHPAQGRLPADKPLHIPVYKAEEVNNVSVAVPSIPEEEMFQRNWARESMRAERNPGKPATVTPVVPQSSEKKTNIMPLVIGAGALLLLTQG